MMGRHGPSGRPSSAPVVDFIIIGAMKCGTTSLHHYLDLHPEIGMAPAKELDFFSGAPTGAGGNFWRGLDWYASCFPAGAGLSGEASPGYTSPDHPEVAERIARLVPDVRLVYLVRDPLDRAVSQYRHHRRERTEQRPLRDALLDPASHYLQRSLYAERLAPFVERFSGSQIAVVDHGDLLHRTAGTVAALCGFLGVEPLAPREVTHRRLNRSAAHAPTVPDDVEAAFTAAVAADARRFDEMRRGVEQIVPLHAPDLR